MTDLKLTGLYRYPVKSLRGESLHACLLSARGIEHDREWMLVDPKGHFLTQRRQPRMSLVTASVDQGLRLHAPGMAPLSLEEDTGDSMMVTVWGDTLEAVVVSETADRWFSDFLGTACHLVHFTGAASRQVDLRFAAAGDQVGFADGFSLMLVSQASLDDLNGRLASPVGMSRFRPNLVVDGCTAFAEDGWTRLRIGSAEFSVVKPCARCNIPNVDPATAAVSEQPMQTLISYRQKAAGQVIFGQNLTHTYPGTLEIGMSVEVLE